MNLSQLEALLALGEVWALVGLHEMAVVDLPQLLVVEILDEEV